MKENGPEPIKNTSAAPDFPEDTEMTRASEALTLPLFQYWYLSQTYKTELKDIENKFGVKINAETSVLISCEKANEMSKSDSVHRATQAFTDLVRNATKNLKSVSVPQTHMESDIMKRTLICNIPYEENKLMLSMSANNNLLFGPELITSVVEKHLHNTETDSKQWRTSGSRTSVQTLDMDFKDTHDHIEMFEAHWNLIKAAFQTHVSEIQDKYKVQFNAESFQGMMKVSARSTSTHQINLEAHALRALTHIYQKAVTSTLTCDLKDASYAGTASQALDRVRSKHDCVAGGESNGSWKLFGLPKHLVSAIADMEKLVGNPVFNDKTKQWLRYLREFPQASGFQREGMEMRGTHGTDWKDGIEGGTFSFNRDSDKDGKDAEKKGSDEEDKCPICLDTFTEKRKLECGHEFCSECLLQSIQSGGEICAICKKVFGTLRGDQPDGRMDVQWSRQSLPGFTGCGMIIIIYNIPDGIQTV